jgi:hypothetical protein
MAQQVTWNLHASMEGFLIFDSDSTSQPLIEIFHKCLTSTHSLTFIGMYWGNLGIVVIIGDFPRTC